MTSKTFYHSIPGSTVIAPDGRVLSFNYEGSLTLSNEEDTALLEQIANAPGSGVSLEPRVATPLTRATAETGEMVAAAAVKAAAQLASKK